ncbi:dienelactone hydrolase family protein [Iodobacter violaceini]|nr:dienelactone hydrolase family protein [Iodobacter violacea]
MKNFAVKCLTTLLCCGLLSAVVASEPEATALNSRLVHFPAFGGKTPLDVMGVFRTPQGTGKFPVVIILHGSAGIDSRGAMHAQNLAKAGIASLELDMWGARGLSGGAKGRPDKVHDTLPDLWGAEVWLANQEKIDAKRIGVMGFSWGGVMAMLSATAENGPPAGVPPLQGNIALYPVCWAYNKVPGYRFQALRATKVLILAGAKDRYDDNEQACPELVQSLEPEYRNQLSVQVYPNAEHGFDMLEKENHYQDPYSHRGKGGESISAPNPEAREDARRRVVSFFNERFAITP